MEQTNKKSQYILWGVALILGLAVISLVGTKVFYGLVVPQVQAVNQLGIFIVLGFSFIAGLAAFFAPCPFAVFPAYIAYYLNIEREASAQNNRRFLHALKIGSIVSLGIFSFYGVLGIAMSLFGAILASYAYYLKLAVIPVFFILGWMLIAGKSFGTRRLDQLTNVIGARARGGKHFINMYLYGIVYGIAAAACHLPILLALSLYPILAGQFLHGLLTFIAYALGVSLLLVVFTILADSGRNFLSQNLGLYGERVKKIGGVILIITGMYLIGFYLIAGM
jgi:cytochrome c biogenesis protein CcdA